MEYNSVRRDQTGERREVLGAGAALYSRHRLHNSGVFKKDNRTMFVALKQVVHSIARGIFIFFGWPVGMSPWHHGR